MNLEQYLDGLDLSNLEKDLLFSDLDDEEDQNDKNSYSKKEQKQQNEDKKENSGL